MEFSRDMARAHLIAARKEHPERYRELCVKYKDSLQRKDLDSSISSIGSPSPGPPNSIPETRWYSDGSAGSAQVAPSLPVLPTFKGLSAVPPSHGLTLPLQGDDVGEPTIPREQPIEHREVAPPPPPEDTKSTAGPALAADDPIVVELRKHIQH